MSLLNASGGGIKIRHIGHAGFIVEAAGARILIDPWFNPSHAGLLHPNPDNSHLEDEVASRRYDILYVSHGHGDHFDKTFLARLQRPTRVICAPWMASDLVGLGFTGAHWGATPIRQDGLRIDVITDDWRQDSMLLIQAEGQRVLFANDCNTDNAAWPRDIDVLACQYSSACYYPTAYEFPPNVMAEKIAAMRRQLMDMLVTKVQLSGAKAYIPCAGPLYMPGERIGPGSPFPVWAEMEAEFKERCPGVEVRTEGLLMAEDDVIIRKETISFPGFVEFRFPAWIWRKVDTGEISFEDALATQCVKIRREPDRFDPALMYPLRGRAWPEPVREAVA